MLISRVADDHGGGGETPPADPLLQYQAADQLFELMAKDSKFDPDEEDTLTQRDLVLLYKNLDLGTQLMCNATVQRPRPNQRVETVVYKDKDEESDESDASGVCSSEDLQSLYLVNKNKSNHSSHTLCNKFGDLDINTSDLTMEYKKKFLFRDPYIQTQLQTLNLFPSSTALDSIVPTSLLDYICCKRLEDNYNFYMDNIIKYVQHTIEQLKRISNGDYLTERVKEKWREVEKKDEKTNRDNNTKVLATSTSIPLHVERKITGCRTTWDDIVHSEVDIRSLSRILEKKIVFEIPKLISGSYKILSKCCIDNLIVSCTKTKVTQVSENTDSRVDVVFELKRSGSGHVISDISSIMIVQTTPGDVFKINSKDNFPVTYLDKAEGSSALSSVTGRDKSLHLIPIEDINLDSSDVKEESKASASEGCNSQYKIIELKDGSQSSRIDILDTKDEVSESSSIVKCLSKNISADQFSTTLTSEDTEFQPAKDGTQSECNDSISVTQNDLDSEKSLDCHQESSDKSEANFDFSPDELGLSMRCLDMQGTLKEESEEDHELKGVGSKKSLTKVRVKSPYENQSFVLEEKKRKRLIEIRDRRERKKLAMQEFCKIVKHKYGKGFAMPQASSSVTKLSITNKSFYNSIYGQNNPVHNKQMRNKAHRRGHKRSIVDIVGKKSTDGDPLDLSLSSMNTERDINKKFINRSYYLDEVETEIMNMDNTVDTERKIGDSTERTNESNNFRAELNMLSELMNPTEEKELSNNTDDAALDKDSLEDEDDDDNSEADEDAENESLSGADDSDSYNPKSRCKLNVTPVPYEGSPSTSLGDIPVSKKSSTSIECRKSIERIYDLMKKLGKTDYFLETRAKNRRLLASDKLMVTRTDSATNPISDSGTSLKHLSSNSCQSFETNKEQKFQTRSKQRRNFLTARESLKLATKTPLQRYDRNKTGRINVVDDKAPEEGGDPIRTISRLINDIDSLTNIPKTAKPEVKPTRNLKTLIDDPKPSPRHNYPKKPAAPKVREPYVVPPELRPRKRPTPPGLIDNKIVVPRLDKFAKRKIIDIIDEEKEARGEAVRGPSKCRLNALAQPRKTYVQAHIAEVQNKYGRSAISDRLQRLAGGPPPSPVNPKLKPIRKILPETLMPTTPRHGPALRTADPERVRARDQAAEATRRRAVDSVPALAEDVESYVNRLYTLGVSPRSHRPPQILDLDIEDAFLDGPLMDMGGPQAIPTNVTLPLRVGVIAPPNLSDLTECTESTRSPRTPRTPRRGSPDTQSRRSPDNQSRRRGSCSPTDMDYLFDALPPPIELNEDDEKGSACSKISKSKSNSEMAKLEAALYNRKAKGAVQSRLRIKNLTLTPRHSLQQLLALQSGDAIDVKASPTGAKLVKSSEDISLLKSLAKGRLEWNLNLRPQVTTVGFAFANFTKPLEEKPRDNFKSSSSGVTSADADHSNKRSCSTIDQEHSKKASESTKSNTISDTLFLQYYPLKTSPQAKKSEVSACVQADCKEFDELYGTCSNQPDEQCLSNIVVDAMKTLVADAMVESAKLQISESRPISSKNKTSGNSGQTVVEKKKEGRSVDIGVGCGEAAVSESQSPRLTTGLAQTEHSVQTVDTLNTSSKAISKAMDSKVVESQANSNKSIDCSNSLDILVGLLNEIQTITTCQTNMTKKMVEKNCENSFNTIFNQTKKRNRQVNHVLSITSLDKMRQLESNPSIYSIYISSDGDYCAGESIKSEIIQTCCLTDREMNTLTNDVVECRLVSRPTDVPSTLFYNFGVQSFLPYPMPPRVHQTTSVTSLTVNHSIISLHDYKSVVSLTPVTSEEAKSSFMRVNTPLAKNASSLTKKAIEGRRRTSARRGKANYVKPIVCDPLIKIKRDILVALYSMLVVTVFAALSFPDLLSYG